MTNFVKAFSEIWQSTLNDFFESNLSVFVKISFSFASYSKKYLPCTKFTFKRHYAKRHYAECLNEINPIAEHFDLILLIV
jgi:hypothetical protein